MTIPRSSQSPSLLSSRVLRALAVSWVLCLGFLSVAMGQVSVSQGSSRVDPLGLVIELEGYNTTVYVANYTTYSSFLQSINVVTYDYLLTQPPDRIVMITYMGQQPGCIVEIHEYESEGAAGGELEAQRRQAARGSPIFLRFDSTERILLVGRFVVFFVGLGADAVMESFVGNMLPLVGEETRTEPPLVSFQGEVVWGVRPGDRLVWSFNGTLFTGYVGGGMSHKEYEEEASWEVVEIADSGRAVLVRETHDGFVAYGEGFYEIDLDVPYHTYSWMTADEPGLLVNTEEGDYGVQAGIYPIQREGQSLRSVVEEVIEGLPQKSVTESDQYVRGYGRTTSAGGYTPIETHRIELTIHKGTGIVTSASSYYNNNEYSITKSGSIALKQANFDLGTRSVVPEASLPVALLCLALALFATGAYGVPSPEPRGLGDLLWGLRLDLPILRLI